MIIGTVELSSGLSSFVYRSAFLYRMRRLRRIDFARFRWVTRLREGLL